jgi:hypothetical protein
VKAIERRDPRGLRNTQGSIRRGLLEQPPPYPMVADLRAHFFDDEDHLSVIPATVSKGLRFVYSTAAADTPVQPSNQ